MFRNTHSESQFKTLKYRPQFPDRFASLSHAHQVIVPTIDWYNRRHHHEALGLLTPYDVHYGLTQRKLELRQKVLDRTYAAHSERFPNGPPKVHAPAEVVWINEPPYPETSPNVAGAEEVTQK